MRSNERGMTLVELLIVVVLGGLILLAMYEVMITNQRTYAAQNADAQAQQTLRAGMSVLFGELREISPPEGDVISMSSSAIRIRTPRGLGILCEIQTNGANPRIMAMRVGDFFAEGDSIAVFYDNDPQLDDDDVWRTTAVTNLNTAGLVCPGTVNPGQVFVLDQLTQGAPPNTLVLGAPIRAYTHHAYYLGDYDGEPYLLRRDQNGAVDPLVGPLAPGDGVTFEFMDGSGNITATPSQVRQIEVTLRTLSGVRGPDGNQLADSLSAVVYTRN